MSKKILFVTGTRADFGKVKPLADACYACGHQVTYFVTGMHMMSKYGLTKTEVHKALAHDVVEFVNQREGDALDQVLAKTVTGFSDYIFENKQDLVVVHGDRVEALASTLVTSMNNLRSAHIEGGEVSGTIDESFRHCNSKLASIHLVSSESAKKRVMALGEPGSNVYVIGSPELDVHSAPSGVLLDQVKDRYNIKFKDFGVVIFHPVTSESDSIYAQTEALFRALTVTTKKFVVISPNNDPGSEEVFRVLSTLSTEQFRVIPSMRFHYFSELMKNASIIVGNSSLGVREAPFLGVPSIDIGTRQTNRVSTDSVKHFDAFCIDEIVGAVNSDWGKRYPLCSEFGSGNAAALFTKLLDSDLFWNGKLQKYFSDQ